MNVLVTGGAGFIGSHIVDRLLAENHSVAVVDNLSTGLASNINSTARFYQMDITKDDLNTLFAAERFDCVVHQAAQTSVPKSLEAPDYDCQVNVLGTVNILEAARKSGTRRIVFASSAAVYGDVPDIPIGENAVNQPSSFYGLSKLIVENYLKMYHNLLGLEYIVLRYANVYGERQGDTGEGGVISIFARKAMEGQPVTIFGSGKQTRDFVYVGDVASANSKALTSSGVNAIYNIGTASETSVNRLVELMEEAAGRKIERNYQSSREGDIFRSSLDNRAAIKNLGWQPRIKLPDGLAATVRFLKGSLTVKV